jgi:DNA ligase 1
MKSNKVLIYINICFLFLLSLAARAQASDVLLAEIAAKNIDPNRYLVSEKLDGVRAIWDGTQLQFRSGNTVPAPAWFTDALPKTPLDGELWLGRGQFEALSGIVRTLSSADQGWRRVRYEVYELPNAPGSFSDRYQQLRRIVASAHFANLHVVEQRIVGSNAALQKWLNAVVKAGGEGLMLHLATAPYQTGRSDALLKLKPVDDAEATVLGYRPGKGKFTGMLGSLELITPAGVRFRVGTGLKNTDRLHPPAIGAQVTYTYRGLTKNGVPRFASFLRVRVEL